MSIADAIFTILSEDAGVSALVGTKIQALKLSQGTPPPAIAFHRVGNLPVIANETSSTLMLSRFRFDCYAKSAKDARTVALAVKNCLDALIITVADIDIQGIMYNDEYDGYNIDADLMVVSVDFIFHYSI